MSHNNSPTADPIHALLAELGIVDPIAIVTAEEQHAEVIAAYRNGKLTEAALRHSLVRTSDIGDSDTTNAETAPPEQSEP